MMTTMLPGVPLEGGFKVAVRGMDEAGGMTATGSETEIAILRQKWDEVVQEVRRVDMEVGETLDRTAHHGDRQWPH
jgi:hypothetical protein